MFSKLPYHHFSVLTPTLSSLCCPLLLGFGTLPTLSPFYLYRLQKNLKEVGLETNSFRPVHSNFCFHHPPSCDSEATHGLQCKYIHPDDWTLNFLCWVRTVMTPFKRYTVFPSSYKPVPVHLFVCFLLGVRYGSPSGSNLSNLVILTLTGTFRLTFGLVVTHVTWDLWPNLR